MAGSLQPGHGDEPAVCAEGAAAGRAGIDVVRDLFDVAAGGLVAVAGVRELLVALGMVVLPGILRWRRAGWHQGLAAAGLAVFLLTLPALAGVQTRTKLGVLLPKETPLRLTPTSDAQTLTRLPGGETARLENERGQFVFIRTANAAGWVERGQFGMICGGGIER